MKRLTNVIASACDFECYNGGVCNGGKCICPDEYTGNQCEQGNILTLTLHFNLIFVIYSVKRINESRLYIIIIISYLNLSIHPVATTTTSRTTTTSSTTTTTGNECDKIVQYSPFTHCLQNV